ncbi:MAG: glycosyltransferase [Pseudonocardiaceae bacterium]|nr:glycosyltransferase [Pseudonocardiaceae bacterium]
MSLPPKRPEASPPMFSFLTTAYRTEQTLPRTVEAVRTQTRGDWELVVVDNGYSDRIAQLVSPHLGDPRVRLVRQRNSGPTGGVMAAAAVAGGRYLTVLNSDDAVAPEFCARMGEVLEADPGIAAVTCDARLFVDPGGRLHRRSYLETAGMRWRPDVGQRLRVADVVDGPCPYYSAAIRRDVWDAMDGLVCDTPIVDDLDFWLRVLLAGYDVRMIPDQLGLFRIEQGSESRPTEASRLEAFEAQRERALVRAATASGAPADAAALGRVLRRLRYDQAIRRARAGLQAGDVATARRQAAVAFSLRRTVRSGAILLALAASPGLLARVHPIKQRVQARLNPP